MHIHMYVERINNHFTILILLLVRKKFVIYNSSPHERVEMIRLWVLTVPVTVYDSQSKPVICQISPYFKDHTSISHNRFKVGPFDSTYKTVTYSCPILTLMVIYSQGLVMQLYTMSPLLYCEIAVPVVHTCTF